MAHLAIFLLIAIVCFSQKNGTDTVRTNNHKISFYGTVGLSPEYGCMLGNVEVPIARPSKFFTAILFRFGIGAFASWESSGLCILPAFNAITGKGKNHFEFGLGVTYLNDQEYYTSESILVPAGNIGYRYHKPDGRFIFRSGLGFPEAFYLSIGFSIH